MKGILGVGVSRPFDVADIERMRALISGPSQHPCRYGHVVHPDYGTYRMAREGEAATYVGCGTCGTLLALVPS